MLENVVFTDDFDEMMASQGPVGLFTLTHEGELQFDLFRTRDWKRRFHSNMSESIIQWCHCVMVDSATGWPMYCLLNSPDLVGSDERTTTTVYSDFHSAQIGLASKKEDFFQKITLKSETV